MPRTVTTATMTIKAIGWTHFEAPDDVPWETDADGGQALAEFAGRACYQSWRKPNPATATNEGYLDHILNVGHLSVLEHGTVTVYMTGVSRSFTHELVRHRHFSYSQLSQRYVPARNAAFVEPDIIAEDPHLHRVFGEVVEAVRAGYSELLHGLERKLEQSATFLCRLCGATVGRHADPSTYVCVTHGLLGRQQVRPASGTALQKAARQAARSVLPNAAETKIVVTGNYRAWRHFIAMRATEAADVEIREGAVACLRVLRQVAPHVFNDFAITELLDGTEVAASARYGAWDA